MEERDCPDQILMGCDDPEYCMLLSLSIYLETWLIVGKGKNSELLFADEASNSKSAERLKTRYQNKLKKIQIGRI